MAQLPKSQELADALQNHIINPWFPRCIDTENGGFFSDFDRTWRCNKQSNKLIEFQTRQTWAAAELLQLEPENKNLLDAVQHGFEFLRDVMWDHKYGGWYHLVDNKGAPLEKETKHVHGLAYGIAACVATYKVTNNLEALELANEAFNWLETFAYDHEYGGYMGFLTRDGSVIDTQSKNPLNYCADTIGTPLGCKDVNVHGDLLDTFILFYNSSQTPQIRKRLLEAADIISKRMATSAGALFSICQADWTLPPQLMRFGYAFQSTNRLLAARKILDDQENSIRLAKSFLDCCLSYGWDYKKCGSFFAAPASFPMTLEGHEMIARRKSWWVQFEVLNALLGISCVVKDNEQYLTYFQSQWHYLCNEFFDSEYQGVYGENVVFSDEQDEALNDKSKTQKGHIWKDCSHEARALLSCYYLLKTHFE